MPYNANGRRAQGGDGLSTCSSCGPAARQEGGSLTKTNRVHLAIGLATLMLGALVYLLDRPAEQSFIPSTISLFQVTPAVFGVIGGSLPAFAHVFAFSLLTAAVLGGAKKARITACLGWCAVDAAFEVGQHPQVANWLSGQLEGFEHLLVLAQTTRYFHYGTFDPWDLLAIVLGALVAYRVVEQTQSRGISHE